MTETAAKPQKLSWRFPDTFWYANGAELCERAAYYGMFISLFRYLNNDVGFSTIQTGYITATFSSLLYLLPTFTGIMADKTGFKRALILAFALLTCGYGLLGAFQVKLTALLSLSLILFGGAIVKPVISGTAAKCSNEINRARAMSIFYMVVNIGSFSGKGLAGYLNEALGLQYINLYAAGMSFTALILVAFFYKSPDLEGAGKTVGEALRGLGKVIKNVRFDALIVIIGGFWAIQGQLYGAMPTYIERLLGRGYKPEWLANINPFVVVLCVVPITHLVRNFKPANAIGIGLLIIPFTALVVSIAPMIEVATGGNINLGITTIHPMILMFVVGIGLQGLAECFLSPKWLEFASKQAPKDEVGLYLGYSHLTTFFAWFFGFILAGYLLAGFCPDPKTFDADTRHEWRQAIDPYYRAYYSDDEAAEQLKKATEAKVESTALTLSDATRARLGAMGVPAGPELALSKIEADGEWKTDATSAWEFAAGEQTWKLVTVEYKIEQKAEVTGPWLVKVWAAIRDFVSISQADTLQEILILSPEKTPADQMEAPARPIPPRPLHLVRVRDRRLHRVLCTAALQIRHRSNRPRPGRRRVADKLQLGSHKKLMLELPPQGTTLGHPVRSSGASG